MAGPLLVRHRTGRESSDPRRDRPKREGQEKCGSLWTATMLLQEEMQIIAGVRKRMKQMTRTMQSELRVFRGSQRLRPRVRPTAATVRSPAILNYWKAALCAIQQFTTLSTAVTAIVTWGKTNPQIRFFAIPAYDCSQYPPN